jgi:nucleotide-binding universal stress UspA family protein
MQKWFLIPTDFSDAAKNAARYACMLAHESGHGVHFFYAFQPDLDVQSPFLYDSMAKLQEMWMEKLEAWTEALRVEECGLARDRVRNEVSIGFAAEEIIKLSQEDEYDMIIMGTKGESGMVGNWLGTVSAKVAQEAYTPVWLVPIEAVNRNFRNILYCSAGDAIEEDMVHQVVSMARKFQSTLHFVHIHNKQGLPEDNVIEKIFDALGAGAFGDLSYIVEMINSDNIIKEINSYVDHNEIDVLVAVTHHKSFWEKLLSSSVTKDLILHAHIPTLVFHQEDKRTLGDFIQKLQGPVVFS